MPMLMPRTTLYCWHRRIGLIVFVAIIAWALSGLSHPIMSRINPRPVMMSPPVSVGSMAKLLPLSSALSLNAIDEFEQVQLINVDDTSFYRVEHGGDTSYIDASSGQRANLNDIDYAKQLARYYLGDTANKIVSVELVSAFNEDYLYINRFLPVYKVTFDRPDNMRAYVEVSTGRLATLIDDRKALVGWVFRQLHSWVFIKNPWLRTIAMSVMLIAGMGLSLVGLLMAWRGRGNRADKKSASKGGVSVWHRRLGIGFGVLMLTFSFSGLYHLLNKPVIAPPPKSPPSTFFTSGNLTLDWPTVADVAGAEYFIRGNLVMVDGMPFFRLVLAAPNVTGKPAKSAGAEHHSNRHVSRGGKLIYINAGSSQLCAHCERKHALNLAEYYSGAASDDKSLNEGQVEKITRFSSDYGFINKRMPVHAVNLGHAPEAGGEAQTTLYVETATGALASRASSFSRLEGWSFSYLHKWHFFDPLSKVLRDILLIITTLAIAVLCLLGAMVSFKSGPDKA